MNILNDKSDINSHTKPEQELVEQEKTEYKLLGTYLRTKGLKLFSYNPIDSEIEEVVITKGSEIHTVFDGQGWIWFDHEFEKATVDSRREYFECLNLRNAINIVNKYKKGNVKYLCNLREPSKEGIKLW